ncbi:MAG: hypothetical protein ACF8NJ_05260, partial [Phycisphaerales bacterium JB038]
MKRKRPRLHLWTWARRGTALLFLALLLIASKVMINNDTANTFQGSAAATTTLDVLPLVDPLALLESTIAARDFPRSPLFLPPDQNDRSTECEQHLATHRP